VRRSRGVAVGAAAAALAVSLVAVGYVVGAKGSGADGRQAEVAERGASVMAFDLDATTHVFRKLADGGAQTVVADDPADTSEVASVRAHLREEARAIARGDFGDPATIHGEEMPGLAQLEAGVRRIEIRYDDVPAGGRIRYSTRERDLVAALHAWFDAQTSDHGRHARAE
jgi:hypothetical protein